MLSRLCRSSLVKELPEKIRLWAREPKDLSNLVRFGAVGAGSFVLLRNFNWTVKCDRLSHSRSKYEADQHLLHHKRDEPVKTDWAEFCRMLWSQKGLLLIAFGSAMIVAWVNIQIPHILGNLVDLVTGSNAKDFIDKLRDPVFKCLKLYLIQAAATFSYIFALSLSAENLAHDLREKYFRSMMNQPLSFYDRHMTGEILGRLTTDIQEFKSSFKQAFSQGLRSTSQSIGCIYSIYLISPGLAKSMLLIIPTVIAIGTTLGGFLRTMSRDAQAQISISGSMADEAFSNIRTVKAFAMEEEESSLHLQESLKLKALNVQLAGGIGVFQGGSNLFLNGVVLAVLYYGGQRMTKNELSPGDLMAFMVASQTIQKSLGNLSQVYGTYVRGIESLNRVQQFIKLDPGPRDGKKYDFPSLLGDVEYRNVVFSYPDRKAVLKRLNLKLPVGKVTALIGGSGSGKSTMVGLLQCLHSANSGEVTINGINVQDIDHNQLNAQLIGVINQEPILFATSIFENIRYGKPNATKEEVYEAARKANAYDFISGFPKGFATVLGEKGVTVSGGQKQRIAIARALIKDPKVLILDEATSALDSESEALIKQTLDAEMKGRTVLVIAHRLSTVRSADNIAVIQDGQIAEVGSHDELLAKKGLYYHLVKAQHIFFE